MKYQWNFGKPKLIGRYLAFVENKYDNEEYIDFHWWDGKKWKVDEMFQVKAWIKIRSVLEHMDTLPEKEGLYVTQTWGLGGETIQVRYYDLENGWHKPKKLEIAGWDYLPERPASYDA